MVSIGKENQGMLLAERMKVLSEQQRCWWRGRRRIVGGWSGDRAWKVRVVALWRE